MASWGKGSVKIGQMGVGGRDATGREVEVSVVNVNAVIHGPNKPVRTKVRPICPTCSFTSFFASFVFALSSRMRFSSVPGKIKDQGKKLIS
jgi:hypothetical protein